MLVPPYETLAVLSQHIDPYAVSEHLQALGSPAEVADAYDQLVRDAYWQHKDIPMVITLATSGIHFCFTHARLVADDSTRAAFKSTAKTLAYNLASFTWPGWDEPGVTISPAERARGFNAARLNLRLALELQKPFDKICDAAWLLGAHFLAAGEPQAAILQFRYALPDTADPRFPLFRGYVLLAEIILRIPTASPAWNDLLTDLHARTDNHAQFARNQLQTAHRVFVK